MSDLEKYESLIPEFLAGRLEGTEKEEFEARLESDTTLDELVQEFRQIAAGLAELDAARAGHIEAETILAWPVFSKNSYLTI